MKVGQKQRSALASIGCLLTALIWGFAFVVVKDSLDIVPPIYMLAFRFTIAAVALWLIFWKKMRRMNRRDLYSGAVLGFFLFLSYALQTIGCGLTTAGKNAFLTTVYVVLVPFFHWIFSRKRPDGYSVAAALTAIVGIGLLSLTDDLSINTGDVLTLLCGIGFAIHILFIDRYTETQDPIILSVLQFAAAAALSWLTAPLFDGGFPTGVFTGKTVTSMLYLGLISTMLAFLLQMICQKYTNPSLAALFLSTESVFGVIFSGIFLHEALTARMYAGCLLMLIAVLTAETKWRFLRKGRVKPLSNVEAPDEGASDPKRTSSGIGGVYTARSE